MPKRKFYRPLDQSTDIRKRAPLSEAIDAYQRQLERIIEAYNTLKDATAKLEDAFMRIDDGDAVVSMSALPHYNESVEDVLDRLKKTAWSRVIAVMGLKSIMSIKRDKEIKEKLSDVSKLPPLTNENVYEMLSLLAGDANTFMKEAVGELFDWLRPDANSWRMKYKTNRKNAAEHVGKKVILSMCSHGYGGYPFRVSEYSEAHFVSLDRVFYALDGKAGKMLGGSHRSPLVDAINTSVEGTGVTDYFKFSCHNNGNIHIEFLRLDLLGEFNALASGMNLRSGLV